MAEVRFPAVKTPPRLTWLAQAKIKARRVPAAVVRELARIQTMEQAQAFVSSAGLEMRTEIKRNSPSVNSVSITPPPSVEAEYHGPQIILPKIDTGAIPAGTVLMNVLLPPIEDIATAERIFAAYQQQILAFATRIQALPFACITGHKTETPRHDLDHRGFRFFFGPAPDVVFERIGLMLSLLGAIKGEIKTTGSKRDLAMAFQALKFIPYNESKIGHSIIEDMMGYNADTALVKNP